MVNVRTGKSWLKKIGENALYSPDLEDGKYYIIKDTFTTKNKDFVYYTFEEAVIID